MKDTANLERNGKRLVQLANLYFIKDLEYDL